MISLTIICILVLGVSVSSAEVSTEADFQIDVSVMENDLSSKINLDAVQAKRMMDVFNRKAQQMSNLVDETLAISETKVVSDFSGNNYIVVECVPIGYMIFHQNSGKFVEYSPKSPSPYSGYSGDNLYYVGPTEYYVLEGDVLTNTLFGDEISIDSMKYLAETCEEINEYYVDSSNQVVLEYIESGIHNNNINVIGAGINLASDVGINAAAEDGTYFVKNWGLIENMVKQSEMSYFSGGACGYIAASMLLLWHDYTNNDSIIDYNNSTGETYTKMKWSSDAGKFYPVFCGDPSTYTDGRTFSHNIWKYHSGESELGSYPWTISKTVSSYMAKKGVEYSYTSTILPTTVNVINFMNTYGSPYELFGSLSIQGNDDRSNHAVLVYGYEQYTYLGIRNYALIAHYGRSNYSMVYIEGIWGGGFAIADVY